jgi:hypothetical protein
MGIAAWRLGTRTFLVHMNPLEVARQFGKPANQVLCDREPIADRGILSG